MAEDYEKTMSTKSQYILSFKNRENPRHYLIIYCQRLLSEISGTLLDLLAIELDSSIRKNFNWIAQSL